MSVRLTDANKVAMFCSTDGWAFGPVFDSQEEAQEFLDWLGEDPRQSSLPWFQTKYREWVELQEATV